MRSVQPPVRMNSSSTTNGKSCTVFRTTLVLSFLCLSALVAENLNLTLVSTATANLPAFHDIIMGSSSVAIRPLPSFAKGGVVIFNHVAKTGGTTIRETFSKQSNIEWQFVGGLDDLLTYSIEVDLRLSGKIRDDKILFLELHGPVPGIFELHDFFDRWHAMAEEHHSSFFTFTVVRDPVAYAVSFFNFILAEPCLFNGCPYKLYAPTEENLIETAQANYQCMYLARDVTWFDFTENQTIPPLATEYECNAVYNVMRMDMDWIGVTEKLTSETMPLLKHMLLTDQHTAVTESSSSPPPPFASAVFNDVQTSKSVVLKADSLHLDTVEYIRAISEYDQSIYDKTARDFPITMWQDLATR